MPQQSSHHYLPRVPTPCAYYTPPYHPATEWALLCRDGDLTSLAYRTPTMRATTEDTQGVRWVRYLWGTPNPGQTIPIHDDNGHHIADVEIQ